MGTAECTYSTGGRDALWNEHQDAAFTQKSWYNGYFNEEFSI